MSLVPFQKSHIPARRSEFMEFDRLFDGLFRNAMSNLTVPMPSVTDLAVRIDVSETDKAYHVKAELPGMSEKEVELNVDDGILTISGEKRSESEEKGKTFHRTERSYGRFSRALQLPADADESRIDARMTHGVLEIEIGKAEAPAKKSKRIDIKAN